MNLKEHLILYVDDEWANRVVFEQAFGGRFRVKALASASAALDLLKEEQAAVILTDQRMPEMSGHDLLARVKALFPDTVRIVITAYSDLDPILRAVNEGLVARYLIKPWDRGELEQMLLWALEAFALGREGSALQLRLMMTERLVTLGSIGAAVLHDLNQPLSNLNFNAERLHQLSASVGALAQLLRAHEAELAAPDRTHLADLAGELPDIVREMKSSCALMHELMGSLRSFVNPQRSRESRPADPVPVIRHALAVCRETAALAHGRLLYDGPAELPQVRANSTELAQVLINLVANATQALLRRTERRGGRVVVSAAEQGGAVRFVVTDDGPGMSPEVLARIGTPFFSTRPDGTGLGVAQCRRLVERAGGSLEITSTEGTGTTAVFTLPKA